MMGEPPLPRTVQPLYLGWVGSLVSLEVLEEPCNFFQLSLTLVPYSSSSNLSSQHDYFLMHRIWGQRRDLT